MERKRFQRLLPLRVENASRRIWLKSLYERRSAILNWETMISNKMQALGMERVHLSNVSAWSLHAPDHGPEFLSLLLALIDTVERGAFPPEQAGRYDVKIDSWKSYLS